MLVNATSMLRAAKAHHYAVGHFNTNNLEWSKAILLGANETNSPVIISSSVGAGKYMGGFKTVASMVRCLDEFLQIKVPVALHLDHGTYDACKACVEAGFTSIMFDGSSFELSENIAKTKELVNLAHNKGLSIEAEVGAIGGTEDGVTADGEVANPKDCAKIAALGIDFLAAGIGNIHGLYPTDWKGLNFEVLEKINQVTNKIPLVLHGGTGIPDKQIIRAIKNGISKINVNTDCQLVFASAMIDYCAAGKADATLDNVDKGYDPRKLLKPGFEAIKNKVIEKIKLFGSDNKADDYLNF